MEDSKVKRTALMSAYLRSHHSRYTSPPIFDDFMAPRLLTEEDHEAFDQGMAAAFPVVAPEEAALNPTREEAVAYMVQFIFPTSLFLSRARYAEERLKEAIKQGVRQYVILGAGMDTFAFRNLDLANQIEIFEIDHPATQAFKRRRLNELGWEVPANLHFVPVDFTKDDLTTSLLASSYDPKLPSFFSWLGVVHYLPRDTVFETLHAIAKLSPSGSRVAFDYWDLDAFIPEKAAKRVNIMHAMLRSAGEPMLTGLHPDTLADELQNIGLHIDEQLSPAEIENRYFKGRIDHYYAYEHAYFVNGRII